VLWGLCVPMGDQTSHDTAIGELACRQHGNVTRAQLLAIGVTPKGIHHRVSTGRLYPVHTGVFAVGRPPRTPHERACAAVLACGPTAALSHSSAMVLWGLWKHWSFPLEVAVKADRRPTGIRTHHIRTLHPKDLTTQHGIRTTTTARTLLDMSRRLTAKQLTRAVNEAIHQRHLRHSHLEELLTRHAQHPNAARLTPYLNKPKTGTSRSQLEDDFLTLCRDHGLPTPLTNHHLAEEAARLRRILDALEERRLSLGSAPDPGSEPRT